MSAPEPRRCECGTILARDNREESCTACMRRFNDRELAAFEEAQRRRRRRERERELERGQA